MKTLDAYNTAHSAGVAQTVPSDWNSAQGFENLPHNIAGMLDFYCQSKVTDLVTAQHLRAVWRLKDRRVVFTNGCFDLLHLGHVDYLEKAAKLGDELIIGLNSDVSIRSIKGENRPVMPQESRARLLAAMEFVSLVILFDEATPAGLITALQPDVLVKGNDYTVDKIAGSDVVLAAGGKVETIPLVEGYSTSAIIEKIRTRG